MNRRGLRNRSLYVNNLLGWVILALHASVGPIKVRQSAIAFSFSKTMTKTGPLSKAMSQHITKQKNESRFLLHSNNNQQHDECQLGMQNHSPLIQRNITIQSARFKVSIHCLNAWNTQTKATIFFVLGIWNILRKIQFRTLQLQQ
jgi:hypothetical protein